MPTTSRSDLQELTRDERNMGLAGQILEAKQLADAYQKSIATGDPKAVLDAVAALAQSAARTRKNLRTAISQRQQDAATPC
jgi:hypothetical protein